MNNTLETLGIQWHMLLVQCIDFVIALLVLWKFAFTPIFKVLEARKAKIAEGLANAERIKAELARTEADRQKVLAEAADLANKIVADARETAARVAEVEAQKATAAAEQIIARAHEAAGQERASTLAALKREVGRLVVQTTMTVTGKVLTPEDQARLAEETQQQIS